MHIVFFLERGPSAMRYIKVLANEMSECVCQMKERSINYLKIGNICEI